MVRQPAVAGSFYPADQKELADLMEGYLDREGPVRPVRGAIVPHAGYIYSGKVAGRVFSQIQIPQHVLLLGPNHHGLGPRVAMSGVAAWQTPLGEVVVDQQLSRALAERIPAIEIDDRAHSYEHSLEVMLPFLQTLVPQVRIVPISLRQLSLADCLSLGNEIAEAVSAFPHEVLMVASSDMNHFLPAVENEKLDRLAIEAMTAYDPRGLYQVVMDKGISMCGVFGAVIVMAAARQLGASRCELLDYAHSGQVNGDNSRVVGYAGLVLE